MGERSDLLEDVVRVLTGDGQLGDGSRQVLVRLLGLLLHQHDPANSIGRALDTAIPLPAAELQC
jgi:hypothetical protein